MNFTNTCIWDGRLLDKTGHMVNRETGLRIHGTVRRVTVSRDEIGFSIDGTTINNAFRWNSWDFEPDEPSVTEKWDAIPVGDWFVLRGLTGEWLMLKITEDRAFHQEHRSIGNAMWRKIKPVSFFRKDLGSFVNWKINTI